MNKSSPISKIMVRRSIFVILIIALVGFAIVITWIGLHGSNESQTPLRGVVQKEPGSIPSDWEWFESKDGEAKFAYPKTWGKLVESETPNPPYNKDGFLSPVAITKKSEFMIMIGKGFLDPDTWYGWDSETNKMYSATDKNPPLDSNKQFTRPYNEPVNLGDKIPLEPLFTNSSTRHAIYEVLGHGAMGCGTHHYFFDIKDMVVHIRASLCSDTNTAETSARFGQEDVIVDGLKEIHKYIQL